MNSGGAPREGIGGKGTFVDEVGPRTGFPRAKHHLLMLSLFLSVFKRCREGTTRSQRRKGRLTKQKGDPVCIQSLDERLPSPRRSQESPQGIRLGSLCPRTSRQDTLKSLRFLFCLAGLVILCQQVVVKPQRGLAVIQKFSRRSDLKAMLSSTSC